MAENIENNGCSQRDSAEHNGYAKAPRSFNRIWKERDSAQPKLLEAILYKDNFNRAYKRVKANKGAPGIDGMTIEEALPYLKEHQQELTDRIYRGKYTPSPVRRVEIPKPDGGVRKLGIPTVIDRTLQQAITQQLVPIYEPLFADGSYGYRPNRSAKDAIQKVKEYAEQGYTFAVVLDLSKYFDTLNHEILINLLRCGAANCDLHKQHFWGGKNDRIKRQVVNQHHIPAVNTALCYHFYESGIPLIAASMMSASMTSFLFCSPIVRASVMTLSISRGIPLL